MQTYVEEAIIKSLSSGEIQYIDVNPADIECLPPWNQQVPQIAVIPLIKQFTSARSANQKIKEQLS